MSKNAACWLGLLGSVCVAVTSALGAFGPKGVAIGGIIGAVGAGITGWLAESPLNHSGS